MNQKNTKQVWVTPKLEQIEMVDTSSVSGCMTNDMPGSKSMSGPENPAQNCSIGS